MAFIAGDIQSTSAANEAFQQNCDRVHGEAFGRKKWEPEVSAWVSERCDPDNWDEQTMLDLLVGGNINVDDWLESYPKLGTNHDYFKYATAHMAHMIHVRIGFGDGSKRCHPLSASEIFQTWAHFASKFAKKDFNFCDNCGTVTVWICFQTNESRNNACAKCVKKYNPQATRLRDGIITQGKNFYCPLCDQVHKSRPEADAHLNGNHYKVKYKVSLRYAYKDEEHQMRVWKFQYNQTLTH